MRNFWLSLGVLLCLSLTSCGSITYVIRAGLHQLRISNSSVPIAKLLDDPRIKKETKQRLRQILRLREFCRTRLGLNVSNNYLSMYEVHGKYVMWAVTAAEPLALKPYTWWFPVIGAVPYKGHPVKSRAVEEGETLKREGYDVLVRGVPAYSTLGWFNDPVFSSMLSYAPIDLINTIIHESAHATIYSESNADFNERVATFIGYKGAELFAIEEYGADSPEVKEIRNQLSDLQLFSGFLNQFVEGLKKVYARKVDDPEKFRMKREYIRSAQTRFREFQKQFSKPRYGHFFNPELNNANILSMVRYDGNLAPFFALLAAKGDDLKATISALESISESDDPLKALDQSILQNAES
jgi:predicted aminopeptidase